MNSVDKKNIRPLIVGEVLFDCFPDGNQVLGGAPFNVAWHLKGFGMEPVFISRIGKDALGERILQRMLAWRMDSSGIQIDAEHPTGQVSIIFENGTHRFDIRAEQAYDYIDETSALMLAEQIHAPLLYAGSLALRQPVSRRAISHLRREASNNFTDINLRAPWYDDDTVKLALQGARWIKINDEELAELSGLPTGDAAQIRQAMQRFLQDYPAELLIVTCGEQGAWLCHGEEVLHAPTAPVRQLADTVGAGDAFSAVCVYGLLLQWPRKTILERALHFASLICEQQGATVDDAGFYRHILQQWEAVS